MKWIPKTALRQSIFIIAIAAVIGLIVNAFHPRKAQLSLTRPPLEYAPDSLLAQDLPAVIIGADHDSVTLTPIENGEPVFVNTKQLQQLVDQHRAVLLDARSRAEYEAEHIPGAMHLPMDLLPDYEKQIDQLPRDKWLICYCEGPPCDLGEILAYELMLMDFKNVAVYRDGLDAWKKVNPTMTGKGEGNFEN